MTDRTLVNGADELRALAGAHLGCTDWLTIDQNRVNQFADATGDHQWIHVDQSRASETPFGGLVAHGYLTLSLLAFLVPQVLVMEGFSAGVNYGLDKVRFPAPVLVGSRVRARVKIDAVTDVPGGLQCVMTVTVEVEGSDKPACVATSISRSYV